MKLLPLLLLFLAPALAVTAAEEKSIRVFVALCDNTSQGIIPVGAKIGNGDDPEDNLYWGCDDGFGSHFRRSKKWKVEESQKDVSTTILRRLRLRHADDKELVLTAEAYRGSDIRLCLEDFEKAAGSGEHDLVAFIGHNVLMDMTIPEAKGKEGNKTGAVVLCCASASYFRPRLEQLGCQPLLLTQQLMYPGSFLLHDVIEVWRKGGSREEMRAAAGRAYARNQKISVAAATNVFAPVTAPPTAGEKAVPGASPSQR